MAMFAIIFIMFVGIVFMIEAADVQKGEKIEDLRNEVLALWE